MKLMWIHPQKAFVYDFLKIGFKYVPEQFTYMPHCKKMALGIRV